MGFKPQIKKLDRDGGSSGFITEGANGITYLHFETPGTGEQWDVSIDATGNWVILATGTSSFFLLESGDCFLLENGDKLILG